MEKKAGRINEMKYFNFKLEPGMEAINKIYKNKNTINLISVITFVNNESKGIEKTATSLMEQTLQNFEWIIIVNSDINEEQMKILNNIKQKDTRIKIFNKKIDNKYEARRYGASLASSDILLLLEPGNLVDKTFLECGYFTLYTNVDAVGAYSKEVYFGDKKKLYSKKVTIDKLSEKNVTSECGFVRKDKFLEIDNYEAIGKNNDADWYMWLYFISKGYKTIRMDYYGYWHYTKKEDTIPKLDENFRVDIKKEYNDVISNLREDSEIMQFENGYKVEYTDVPKKIEICTKNNIKKDKSKKILFIVPWSLIGGSEIFNLNLLKGLKEKGYKISVISTKKCGYVLRQDMETYAEEYFDLTTFLKRKDWASFIYHIIKTRKIDCVFMTNSYFAYYALPWLKSQFMKIPFVDYVHIEKWSLRNGGYPKDSNVLADYLDKTFTCTKFLKQTMYTTMNRSIKNVKEMYIGTDTDYHHPKLEYAGEKELKEKLKDKKVILLPCRISYYKRPIFAVKLMKRIAEKRKDITLLIVGDGELQEETMQCISDNKLEKYIVWEGMNKDIRKYYKVADVTLVCSLREGLSLTTYESLAMGTPVVSADVGGQKELVNNKCGRLIKAYQTSEEILNFDYAEEELKEYENAIYEILDNENIQEMKKYCRKRVVDGFSIKNLINNMDREFSKLIQEGSKVDAKLCKNIEFAERYLLTHEILESKEEKEK